MSAEKENVFRTLREEPLLASRLRCRFGWHKWLKWSKAYKESYYHAQERYCDSCNKFDRRKLKLPL
jgi:hypothetical protein